MFLFLSFSLLTLRAVRSRTHLLSVHIRTVQKRHDEPLMKTYLESLIVLNVHVQHLQTSGEICFAISHEGFLKNTKCHWRHLGGFDSHSIGHRFTHKHAA